VSWGIYLVSAVLLIVTVLNVVATRRETRELRPARTQAGIPLPEGFEALLDERIARLEQDLNRNPRHPAALYLLAGSHARKALLVGVGTEKGTAALERASRAVEDLSNEAPELAALLGAGLQHPERLSWTLPRGEGPTRPLPNEIPSASRGLYPAGLAPEVRLGSLGMPSGGMPLGGALSGGAPSGGAPSGPAPLLPTATPIGPAEAVGSEQPPPAHTGPPRDESQDDPRRQTLARINGMERQRRMVAQQRPQDPQALAGLADVLLMQLGVRYQADQEESPLRDLALRREAAELYLQAAELEPVQLDRSSRYLQASRVLGDLGEWTQASQVARKAARSTPYIASVWRELQVAALQAGDMALYREATRRYEQWYLPELESVLPNHPGGLRSMPGG
jgi:hypothetical protein